MNIALKRTVCTEALIQVDAVCANAAILARPWLAFVQIDFTKGPSKTCKTNQERNFWAHLRPRLSSSQRVFRDGADSKCTSGSCRLSSLHRLMAVNKKPTSRWLIAWNKLCFRSASAHGRAVHSNNGHVQPHGPLMRLMKEASASLVKRKASKKKKKKNCIQASWGFFSVQTWMEISAQVRQSSGEAELTVMEASAELCLRQPEIWISAFRGGSVTGKAESTQSSEKWLKRNHYSSQRFQINTRLRPVKSEGSDCAVGEGGDYTVWKAGSHRLPLRSNQRRAATSELNHRCLQHARRGGFQLSFQMARMLDNCSGR